MKIGDYEIDRKLFQNQQTSVFEATHAQKGESFIVKVQVDDYPTAEQIERFRAEFETGQSLTTQSPPDQGLAKYLELVPHGNGLAIVLEYFNGQALDGFLSDGRQLSVDEFLKVTPLIVKALKEMHRQRIVHRDISADNILVNKDLTEIRLIDFGISNSFDQVGETKSGGKIHYMSPEQTGRINRQTDYRTDFYSLGILFYRMLAGRFPFESDDPHNIIHQHIATVPPPLTERVRDVPGVLAAIIHKLLSKNPDERYQSANGLERDLLRCADSLEVEGKIPFFELAENDFSSIFRLPRHLFGREEEIQKLTDNCSTCINRRTTQFLLVKGAPGIGKSSLVQELRQKVLQEDGFFLEGKYELLQQPVPYSGLIRAFEGLLTQLMTEHKAKLSFWKSQLEDALSQNGKVLTDVFPTLEKIIGRQTALEVLQTSDAQNRFEFAFGEFLKVFTSQPYPITIFLDDLQWIDAASLHLLQQLLANNQDQMLLVIGAYRDNEVDESHPLHIMLEGFKQGHFPYEEIMLNHLPLEEVQKMISYCLMRPVEEVTTLAKQVHRKTQGNPFYIHRFLQSLHEQGHIYPDLEEGLWQWNEDEIDKESVTENVVDFLVKQMDELSDEVRTYLGTGAAIGNEFADSLLADLYDVSEEEINKSLNTAVKEAFLYREGTQYVFVHDRIHQAAYAIIKDKEALHLLIGRYFESTADGRGDDWIFQITNQLNRAIPMIKTPASRLRLARFNIEAGLKAKEAIAFDASMDLLQRAQQLLEDQDPWNEHYDLQWRLLFEQIELEFIRGNSSTANGLAVEALNRAKGNLEKASVYNLLTVFSTMQVQYPEALEYGRSGLQLLDIAIPDEANLEAAIGQGFMKIGELMGGKPPIDLLDKPALQLDDPAAMKIRILVNMCSPAYLGGESNLWTFLVNESVARSIEEGNIPESCTGYSSYGILCGLAFGDFQQGYAFGDLSYQLSHKLNSVRQRSNTCFVMGCFLNPYARSMKHTFPFLQEGLMAGLQSGEVQFAGYNAATFGLAHMASGAPLSVLIEHCDRGVEIAEKTKNDFTKTNLLPFYVIARDLVEGDPTMGHQKYANATDDELFALIEQAHNLSGKMFFFVFKAYVSYMQGKPMEAYEHIKNATMLLFAVPGIIIMVDYHTYLPLIALELLAENGPDEELEKVVAESKAALEQWNASVPENFQFRLDLVKAIEQEIAGDHLAALHLYESSVQGASKYAMLPVKAIALEKAGAMMRKIGVDRMGDMHLKDAYLAYQEYGATVKLTQLEEDHPALFQKHADLERMDATSYVTSQSLEAFDSQTLVKSSLAISEEVTLKGVLSRMMEVVFEHAGAEKGFFLLGEEGDWKIEAQGHLNPRKFSFLQGIPATAENGNGALLPMEIINYVQNTKEDLLLEDAVSSSEFAHLPYIRQQGVRSVLCLPVLRHGMLTAILYLENSLSAGAFTREQLELLRILSSQMAISVANARLYEDLERKVAERTAEINSQKNELETTLQNLRQTQTQLVQSEKMASLGELTAGIAHEIQNPLNFVNNFSDVNTELLDDLMEEAAKGNTEEVSEIVKDLRTNEQKINHHGRRAEEIVKSMLQHSRVGDGKTISTDLNALADEYLRLAYHGLRAKDPSFNVEFVTDFDETLPKVDVVPQDIGRVLLNLINNAFAAVSEKQKSIRAAALVEEHSQGSDGAAVFTPIVKVSSQISGDLVVVTVSDNGPGIPEEIHDKIMQPFFTTKPPGSGTGLGLSLSYDIITKGHGGTLELKNHPDEGVVVTVSLPLNSHHQT